MAKNKRAHDNVVMVGEVNGFHIQVLAVVEDGIERYQFRILKNDEMVRWPENAFDTADSAFQNAVLWLIPDAEPLNVEDIPQRMFDELNLMLLHQPKEGEIKTLAEAVILREEMAMNFTEALAEAAAANKMMGSLVRLAIETVGPLASETLDAIALQTLLTHLLNVALTVNDRDITLLSTFIHACLGKE